jgi:genome maintenance exonuclease 1
MFNHVELNLPSLEREMIDGVRYYKVGDKDELQKFVSITSVISHFNKEKFASWRKRVGDEEADRITRKATSRGTDTHTLIEQYINNIYTLEGSLYSQYLGVAGTVDCIAEFDGELSIIDFKTSKQPKPRDWIDGYFVQCCAYACMLHELTGLSVKKFVIIMTCENGEVEVYEEYDKAKYIRLLTQYIKKFVNDKLEQVS